MKKIKVEEQWKELISLMQKECELLDTFAEVSKELKTELQNRNWRLLEESFRKMDNTAKDLDLLEQERMDLVNKIAENDDLEQCITQISPELRSEFYRWKSLLKSRLSTLQNNTQEIARYAKYRGQLSRAIMEELFPTTRGRLYDNKGQSNQGEMDSMIISHQL